MQSKAKTVEHYLKELPLDRQNAINKVRQVILKNLPKGYKERMNWGMISYEIPLKTYPNTYNKQPLLYAALASQKNHMAVYLNNIYASPETEKWFKNEYLKTGKRYDCGKCCVRFRKLEDLPIDLIGKAISRNSVTDYIKIYESSTKK